ncbi:hypothetical protein MT_57015 [Pseudomonas phage phiPto-bp6g]|nr:hypothetical protein MT_57015 [Pseudomonas phage phiPto-bp6g]
MSRREYRVTQLTHGDNTFSFFVEYRVNAHSNWLTVCTRDTLDLAKTAINVMKRGEIISKEVVYVE